ncbi:hypothetical protein SAMN05661091_4908 [Paenibacillus uliginis N3/975]|uniref:Transposase n=1 Tax=Paenibacillus uliginis N3/975 TaxID=1313296 RepID=A0A1X7HNV2_9BACL|nr:hypothetical protein [Paenibacillus uliginis]SMF90145.1 hypothetical protein SAMN05661091_4908 [Paenibacillus uliginis N3/975]
MDKDQRHQEWVSRIEDFKASGLTMVAWCESRQYSIHQLKYWLRKLSPVKLTPHLLQPRSIHHEPFPVLKVSI